jgi:hypothetical protein
MLKALSLFLAKIIIGLAVAGLVLPGVLYLLPEGARTPIIFWIVMPLCVLLTVLILPLGKWLGGPKTGG